MIYSNSFVFGYSSSQVSCNTFSSIIFGEYNLITRYSDRRNQLGLHYCLRSCSYKEFSTQIAAVYIGTYAFEK